MNDTQHKILHICEHYGDFGWISAVYFMEKNKKTYDTIAKNLKILFDKDILERKAVGKPWRYYYRLKTEEAK